MCVRRRRGLARRVDLDSGKDTLAQELSLDERLQSTRLRQRQVQWSLIWLRASKVVQGWYLSARRKSRNPGVVMERPQIGMFHLVVGVSVTVMLQYIITGWVSGYGGNHEVVSYVSFAGTIVSIILAVLAIIYSFVQSLGQQRDSATISAQINLLRHVVEEARTSGTDLAEQLERLTQIQTQLDASLSLHQESKAEVKAISSEITAIRGALEKRSSPHRVEGRENDGPRSLATRLVTAANDSQLAAYMEMAIASDATPKSTARNRGERFAMAMDAAAGEANTLGVTAYQTYFLGIANTLLDLGLVHWQGGGKARTVHADFATQIRARVERVLAEDASNWPRTSAVQQLDTPPQPRAN